MVKEMEMDTQPCSTTSVNEQIGQSLSAGHVEIRMYKEI